MKERFQLIENAYNKKHIFFKKTYYSSNSDAEYYNFITLRVGDKVSHLNYGPGKIIKIFDHETCEVDFEGGIGCDNVTMFPAAKRKIRADYLKF